MSVAKNIEITSTSPTSFEDAIENGIARATKTIKNVSGAWIKDQTIKISDGAATEYQVAMILTFVLNDGDGDDDDNDEETEVGSGSTRGGGSNKKTKSGRK